MSVSSSPSRSDAAAPGPGWSDSRRRARLSSRRRARLGSPVAYAWLIALRTELRIRSGSDSVTLRFLWAWQRWSSARSPKTSSTALRNALAPSITTRMARLGLSPRSIRSASNALRAVVFSVAPSRSPSRCFSPLQSDAHHRQHHVIGEVHAVDHEGDQLKPAQITLHQL